MLAMPICASGMAQNKRVTLGNDIKVQNLNFIRHFQVGFEEEANPASHISSSTTRTLSNNNLLFKIVLFTK